MFSKNRFLPQLIVVACMSGVCRFAVGDDGPAKSGRSTGARASSTAATDARSDKSLREQDIYIPYEKLRQVFEKHGRGVFLPYEKFEELWRAAQDKTRPAAEPRPPVGAVITEIENEAAVAKDVVRVKAAREDRPAWPKAGTRFRCGCPTRPSPAPRLRGEPARIVGRARRGLPPAGREEGQRSPSRSCSRWNMPRRSARCRARTASRSRPRRPR